MIRRTRHNVMSCINVCLVSQGNVNKPSCSTHKQLISFHVGFHVLSRLCQVKGKRLSLFITSPRSTQYSTAINMLLETQCLMENSNRKSHNLKLFLACRTSPQPQYQMRYRCQRFSDHIFPVSSSTILSHINPCNF